MACLFPRTIRVKRKDVAKWCVARDVGTDFLCVRVPCGHCAGCLKDKQNEWAFRILCESEDYIGKTYFVRLSYSPDFLPIAENGMPTLVKSDLQRFIRYFRNAGHKCRYFACGEYGSLGRPHYHVILFMDKPFKSNKELYSAVESAWSFQKDKFSSERVLIGSTNCKYFKWQDANYVGKYTTKDIDRSYDGVQPPFHLQSRKPALGDAYFQRYKDKIRCKSLFALTDSRGFVHPIPRTFLQKIYSYRELQIHSKCESVIREGRERLAERIHDFRFGEHTFRRDKYYHNLAKNEREISRSRERQRNELWCLSRKTF